MKNTMSIKEESAIIFHTQKGIFILMNQLINLNGFYFRVGSWELVQFYLRFFLGFPFDIAGCLVFDSIIWTFRVAVVQWSKACLYHFTTAIPGSIPGVGTNIYLGLIWVPCSLAIVTAMTSLCWHKVNEK
jgi:hypothetical protein